MLEITLYIVDETRLPTYLPRLSDQEKYDKLVEAVQKHGKVSAELRIRADALIKALEAIDREIGNTGFLPVFSFNNSPGNVLGNESDCPAFGYFNPAQVKDLYASLNSLPPYVVETMVERGGHMLEEVYQAFDTASKQASDLGHALAIIHE